MKLTSAVKLLNLFLSSLLMYWVKKPEVFFQFGWGENKGSLNKFSSISFYLPLNHSHPTLLSESVCLSKASFNGLNQCLWVRWGPYGRSLLARGAPERSLPKMVAHDRCFFSHTHKYQMALLSLVRYKLTPGVYLLNLFFSVTDVLGKLVRVFVCSRKSLTALTNVCRSGKDRVEGAYCSGEHLKGACPRREDLIDSCLFSHTNKYETRLLSQVRNKHSSLFFWSVSDEEKLFKTWTWSDNLVKLFFLRHWHFNKIR